MKGKKMLTHFVVGSLCLVCEVGFSEKAFVNYISRKSAYIQPFKKTKNKNY